MYTLACAVRIRGHCTFRAEFLIVCVFILTAVTDLVTMINNYNKLIIHKTCSEIRRGCDLKLNDGYMLLTACIC